MKYVYVSSQGEIVRSHQDCLFELVLQDFVRAVLREFHEVLTGVHRGALLVGRTFQSVICDLINRNLVFQAAESSLRQSLATRQPLNELGSEIWFHLHDEAQEVSVAATLCGEAVVGLDSFL